MKGNLRTKLYAMSVHSSLWRCWYLDGLNWQKCTVIYCISVPYSLMIFRILLHSKIPQTSCDDELPVNSPSTHHPPKKCSLLWVCSSVQTLGTQAVGFGVVWSWAEFRKRLKKSDLSHVSRGLLWRPLLHSSVAQAADAQGATKAKQQGHPGQPDDT